MKIVLSLLVVGALLSGCASTPPKVTAEPTFQGTATGHFCWVARPQVIAVTMYIAVDGVEAATSGKNEIVKFSFLAGERKIKAGVKASLGALMAKKTILSRFEPDQNYYFVWTDEWRPGGPQGGYVDMFLYKVTKEEFETLTQGATPKVATTIPAH